MNMRSVTDDKSSEASDLTPRARIRNAAIELIGIHGFDRTSMRMIAQAAGVSPALVVHHFGDKNGLRSACNAHVIAIFTEESASADSSPTIETIQTALADLDAYGPSLNYLAQMLTAESSGSDAHHLFDGFLRGTLETIRLQESAGIIRPQNDPEGSALLITVFGLAPLLMRHQFARALGEDELTPAALARITLPLLELFTYGFYSDDSILQAAKSAMQQEEGNRP